MKIFRQYAYLAALTLIFTKAASAAVVLTLDTTAINLQPGESFTVTLSLMGNANEQITGIDYYWRLTELTGNLGGEILLTDRTIGASPFSDTYFSDAAVEASPGNLLDPQNNHDLGASLADINAPLNNGTWLVATYIFTLSQSATFGESATLATFSNPGQGWVGPGPDFEESSFDSQATVTITVIPEPSTALLVGGALTLFVAVRRTRRKPALLKSTKMSVAPYCASIAKR